MIKLLFKILFLLIVQSVAAQSKYNFGIEGGLSNNTITRTLKVERYNSISLLTDVVGVAHFEYGLNFKRPIKKHLSLNANLYYRKTQKYFKRIYYSEAFYDERQEHATMDFRKITLLLSVSYGFGKKNLPSFFIGFEPNYFLSGNAKVHYRGEKYAEGTSSTQTKFYSQINTYFISNPDSDYSVWRLTPQCAYGVNFPMLKHFQMNFVAHLGFRLIRDDFTIFMRNNDFSLSLSYFIKELYSKKPKENPFD